MKIEKIKHISGLFKDLKSIYDLLELITYSDSLQKTSTYKKKDEIKIPLLVQLVAEKKYLYRVVKIPKKSGGSRILLCPHGYLKKIQKYLSIWLSGVYAPSPFVKGFVAGQSVVTNAKPHVGKKYVLNIDLKNFFETITANRLKIVLSKMEGLRWDKEVIDLIVDLVTYEDYLPQGAPSSPVLANMACINLDEKLGNLAEEHNFTYTRYADDITISSDDDIYSTSFHLTLIAIIRSEGFEINDKKVRLQKNGVFENGVLIKNKQEVTGIIVNEKVNVSRKYIRNLKAALHNWEKNGYASASASFLNKYFKNEKSYLRYRSSPPDFDKFIFGKINYLEMVRGKDDLMYKKMINLYNRLMQK